MNWIRCEVENEPQTIPPSQYSNLKMKNDDEAEEKKEVDAGTVPFHFV